MHIYTHTDTHKFFVYYTVTHASSWDNPSAFFTFSKLHHSLLNASSTSSRNPCHIEIYIHVCFSPPYRDEIFPKALNHYYILLVYIRGSDIVYELKTISNRLEITNLTEPVKNHTIHH